MENKPSHPTRPELEVYETAARILCAKRGVDPDEFKDIPHETIAGMTYRVHRWQAVAEECIDFSMMLTSLREAATMVQPPQKKPN